MDRIITESECMWRWLSKSRYTHIWMLGRHEQEIRFFILRAAIFRISIWSLQEHVIPLFHLAYHYMIDSLNTDTAYTLFYAIALLTLCAGNSPVTGEFPTQKPVTRSFDIFFHLRLNKRLSKQSWDWWFERTSCSLWRHCNAMNSSSWWLCSECYY